MTANLRYIHRKSIVSRHKLTFRFQKLYQFIRIHIFCRASIEMLMLTEFGVVTYVTRTYKK